MKIQLDVNLVEYSNAFLKDVCVHTDDPKVLDEISQFIRENPEHACTEFERYGSYDAELWIVAIAIVKNKQVSNTAILNLCLSQNTAVREVVAEIAPLGEEAINILSNDEDDDVIKYLICKDRVDKKTFDHIFERIITDKLIFLEQLLQNDYYDFMKCILTNKHISLKQRKQLKKWLYARCEVEALKEYMVSNGIYDFA